MKKLRYFFLIVLLMATAEPVHAADITVDTDGICTLANAIIAANNNADEEGCVGSGLYGDDTIFLETDVILEQGVNARPPIITSITIEGQGHTIDGNGKLGYVLKINDKMGAGGPYYGNLTLNNATITGGNHSHDDTQLESNGGGICNGYEGILTLNNSTVSGNRAKGNGGGIFSNPRG
ncbi:MAG: hypothetical protein D3923_17700, partial [Candidatus Electrothrix sp. AR3]|nr:hypothetical protein [Candidatus Electrothrix sp. AR3]